MISPGSGRAPRPDFASLVQKLPHPDRMLGLTHITSSYTLRSIIEDGKVLPTLCKTLKQPLIYTFYGRASFRSKNDFVPTDLPSLFPSVLIFDPKLVPTPRYVFGFDSGAFISGQIDEYLHPHMPLFDFLLSPEPESAARLVNAIFADADSYLNNRPTPRLSISSSDFEAESYLRIVTGGRGSNRLDDRTSTPEIVFADAIEIAPAVIAAILPDTLAVDEAIGGKLKKSGIRIYEYPFVGCSRPGEANLHIRTIARNIYEDFDLI